MNRPILLAPAGNYECFKGDINAGADAVYLGGDRFSARAYADNFTTEDVCRAVNEAHFFGRRVYLTLNTLIKDSELEDAVSYIRPMYEAGLDAIIVQDLGLISAIRKTYPDLDIHASTQMTISGEEGALYLKGIGIDCVVPSRELSLPEIKRMKEKTGMKLECFIHGAMCYCYSGQCLMSSMLGDRSGNRGRCAQPCRMMYDTVINGEDPDRLRTTPYPLSMRDMCTISILPNLIEAGIDMFKIEGRMKSPEYAAGVTAIYRKYIDRYFDKGSDSYSVDDEDMNILRHLYVRNQLQDGYYNRPNGADMISGDRPGYSGSDDRILDEIRERYLQGYDKTVLTAEAEMHIGSPARLTISDGMILGRSETGIVQKAQKVPVTKEDVMLRLSKTGGTVVDIPAGNMTLSSDDDMFMPNGMINELRRNAIDDYVKNKICSYGIYRNNDEHIADNALQESGNEVTKAVECRCTDQHSGIHDKKDHIINVSVMTYEQFEAVIRSACHRIMIDSELYLSCHDEITEIIENEKDKGVSHEYYIVLPYIFRSSRNIDRNFMNDICEVSSDDENISGYMFRNADELMYLKKVLKSAGNPRIRLISDAGFYAFNKETVSLISRDLSCITLPYELNCHEISTLVNETASASSDDPAGMTDKELIVYSTIPMMVTANCIRKTAGRCLRNRSRSGDCQTLDIKTGLRDKKGIRFPVYTDCTHCYNVIYNSVPLNLSGHMKEAVKTGASSFRLDFVYENGSEVTRIMSAFESYDKSGDASTTYKLRPNSYTTGHFIHGIQ